MEDLYRVNKLIRCLISWSLENTEIETLASDCVIKKDVTTMPLLIYYDELYIYVTSFNKRSYLRNLVNHLIERV